MFDFRRASRRQWGQLLFGLALYGIAITLMLQSDLGLGPWDMFHQGIHLIFGMPVGVASEVVGFVLLFALLFARVRFGWGTISNIVLIGLVTDLTLPLVPQATEFGWKLGYYLVALAACGLATGAYIGAGMGAGPRDSLMMLLSRRTGWPVRRVRTAIELVVLACGWLMGGQAGLGTVIFALGIGPAAQWGLKLFGATPGHAPAVARNPEAGIVNELGVRS
jgi:uncharacterized protein